jgi:hypothetical protein
VQAFDANQYRCCLRRYRFGNFLSPQVCERLSFVTAAFAIRRLLAILMIAGLALAPVSRPVMAMPSSHDQQRAMMDAMSPVPSDVTVSEHSQSDMSAAIDTAEMGDMPCCPAKAPTPLDCDKCVYMAACGSICFAGINASDLTPVLRALSHVLPVRNEFSPDGLRHPPPEHPPRPLV